MIGETVVDVLRAENFAVDWIQDGVSAQAALRAQAYDLVLLDLALPGKDGIDVLRALRAAKSRTPVLISSREWAVLEPLIARPGAVLSRAQLEEKIFGFDDSIASNAVEVYVHGLRKKLGAGLIQNVRGLGYLVPRE